MIESPLLDELFAEREVKVFRELVLKKLEARFGPLPPDISASVRVVPDRPGLEALLDAVYSSHSLDDFRARLTPPQTPAAN